MTRLPEVYGELEILVNISSMKVADFAVVRVVLVMNGRRRDVYIYSRKFEMSLFI